MIEINPTSRHRDQKNKIKSKKRPGSISTKQSDFAAELDKTMTVNQDLTIEELLDDLKDHEQQFLDNQTYVELNKYKNVVQKLLKIILSEGFQTKTLKRTRKDRADFTIIGNINLKLSEMSNAITKSNKAFNLLKTIEEIRGLLLDLIY